MTQTGQTLIDQLRSVTKDTVGRTPETAIVSAVGLKGISVRLSSTSTLVENIPIQGGPGGLLVGDTVYLTWYGDTPIATSTKTGGEIVLSSTSGYGGAVGSTVTLPQVQALVTSLQAKMQGIFAPLVHDHSTAWIKAVGGDIGGWTIASDRISNTNAILSSGTKGIYDTTATGGFVSFGPTPPTDYGNTVGAYLGFTSGKAKFSLYSDASNFLQWDGSNLTLSGRITATSGSIGGFSIGATAIDGANVKLSSANGGSIAFGATVPAAYGAVGVWLGYASTVAKFSLYKDANNYLQWDGSSLAIKTANFTLTSAGAISATSGSVGGFTLGASSIDGANTKLSSANGGSIAFGATVPSAYGGTGAWLGYDASVAKLSLVKDSTNYFKWSGSQLTFQAGNISLDASGNLTSGSSFSSGISGWSIYGNGNAEFANATIRGELRSAVFKVNEILATAGTLGVFKSASTLTASCITVDYPTQFTLTAKNSELSHGALFAQGDILRLKEPPGYDNWVTVSSGSANAPTNNYPTADTTTYKCTKISGTAHAFTAGQAVIDYGPVGTGFVTVSADGGVGASPNLTMAITTADPTMPTPLMRLGNLNGVTSSITSDIYGAYIGNATSFLRYDPTTGLQVRGNVLIGENLGSNYGVNVGEAMMVCRFDGPGPYNLDFTGNPNGHKGQVGTTDGGVIYRPGKAGKAIQLAEATTNLVPNPSFETGLTGWGSYNVISSRQTGGFAGSYCLRIVYSGSGDNFAYANCETGASIAGRTFTLQFWARLSQAGAYTMLGECIIQAAGGNYECQAAPVIGLTTDWQYFTVTKTFTMATTAVRAILRPSYNITGAYIEYDAVQIEEKAYATPYCDGSLGNGHSWTSTAHASASIRTDASISYPAAGVIDITKPGSISFWRKREYNNPAASYSRWLEIGAWTWPASTNWLSILDAGSDAAVDFCIYSANGQSCQIAAAVPNDSAYHHYAMVWDGAYVYTYIDGVLSAGPQVRAFPTATPATLYLYAQMHSLDDLCILGRALTAVEIKAIYTSNTPIIVQSSNYELTLAGANTGRVIGHGNGLFGYDASNNESFALAANTTNWGGLTLAAGDLVLGNPDGSHLMYDASAGTLSIISPPANISNSTLTNNPPSDWVNANLVAAPPSNWVNGNISIGADGSLSGAGGGRVTVAGIGGIVSGGAAADINDVLHTTTINGGKITTGSITATQIAATAINSMTITGATIRTAASPDIRVEMNSAGIAGYSDATTKQFYLDATTGKAYAGNGNVQLDINGLTVASGVSGRYIDLECGVTLGTCGYLRSSTSDMAGHADVFLHAKNTGTNGCGAIELKTFDSGIYGTGTASVLLSTQYGLTVGTAISPIPTYIYGNVSVGTFATGGAKFAVSTGTGDPNYPTLGTGKGNTFFASNDSKYGLYTGSVTADGNTWLQVMRNDAATAYHLVLQPVGGNVGIGTTTPSYTLDVNGTINAVTNYRKNGTVGYIFVPFPTPALVWDNQAITTFAVQALALTAYGVPLAAKAVAVTIDVTESGNPSGCVLALGPSATYYFSMICRPQVINVKNTVSGLIITGTNGAMYYGGTTSGTETMRVTWRIWGYFI